MDGNRFDALAKGLADRQSRRGALRLLGTGAIAAVGMTGFVRGVEAAKAGKVAVCHRTGSASHPFQFITVSANAVEAHRAHGDAIAPDFMTDPGNCGGCGVVCASGSCAGGVCGSGGAQSGFQSFNLVNFTCPSGATGFSYSGALDPTSPEQAEAACNACYLTPCVLNTADCTGAAYGPNGDTGYVCGDAYFGYQSGGCIEGAGRIWAICYAATTYGYWGQ